MTKSIVENVRIAYASGKYDKFELFLSYKDVLKGIDIEPIINYEVLPEVKQELKLRILEVPKAQQFYLEYQEALRKEVEAAEAMELSGLKYYPYAERADILKSRLEDNIKTLQTITINELRGFFLPDEDLENTLV